MLRFAILRGFRVDAESTILFVESAESTPRIKSPSDPFIASPSACGAEVCQFAMTGVKKIAPLRPSMRYARPKNDFLCLLTVNAEP
jgi:hypothetical protein